MEGGIYAEDKCPVCQSKFKHDPNRGYICRKHKTQSARLRVQFRGIRRRFNDYEEASKFLAGIRWKAKEHTFDPRDYESDNPLGFSNYVTKYLKTKEKKKSYRHIKQHLEKACIAWENRNIKSIQYGDLEDLLMSLDTLSGKTKHNILSDIHAFFTWACKREKKLDMPQFPQVDYRLGWRTIVEPETQETIIDKVKELSYDLNPKIWLGIKWLSTYISIRPGELINIKEGDFDLTLGVLLIRDPKEPTPKTVPLLEEDIDILKAMPRGLPQLYFFRHTAGKGIQKGSRFGNKYFWKWWKRACKELKIEGVDLYGGTRHSTARKMRHQLSPEQIKRATMHTTNKAFERYFQIEIEDLRDLYAVGTNWGQKNTPPEKGKVLKLKS